MIEIQSTCGACGTALELTPSDLLLLVPVEEAADRTARLVHGCAQCGETSVHAIDPKLGRLLIAKGVPSLPDLDLQPAQLPHPENPPDGNSWSADDLIELHDLLERDDWFDSLLAA